MICFEHTIRNPIGLHALPAKLLADMVKERNYSMTISWNGRTARANRVIQVVSLGAVSGATVLVKVTGHVTDEDIRLIRSFFDEQI